MKTIITSGHNRSLATIALLHELGTNGHEITEVIIVKAFTIKRVSAYLKQFDLNTIVAKFTSHYLQKGGSYLSAETQSIKNHVKSKKIVETSISGYCTKKKIPYQFVNSLSSSQTIDHCVKLAADIVVYSGGGILRKDFMTTTKFGVLNAHSGPLPHIRGMNAIEWSLIEGRDPTTTIHLIDDGIDTGKVLYAEKLRLNKGDNIYNLRGRAIVHNISLLTRILNDFDHYYTNASEQNLSLGRQYFVMHKMMKKCISLGR